MISEEIQDEQLIGVDPKRFFRILFLDDNPDDIELMQHELEEAKFSYVCQMTDRKADFIDMVASFKPHIILADYSLASFSGVHAFKMLKEEGINVPFILVTGALSEKLALECLKVGIDDFVLKASLKRLPAAIISSIEKKEVEEAKNRMAAELEKSHEELRLLLNRHHISMEEERINIAKGLHDELGQVLAALKIDITILQKKIKESKNLTEEFVNKEFNSIIGLVDQITQSVKEISADLRPETLDELGIVEALRWQVIEFEKRNKIKCTAVLPSEELNIDKNLSIVVFRIVQESLSNVVRHAGATEVDIHLVNTGHFLLLEIKDNGKGITANEIHSSKSLGLIGLRERVHALEGTFIINGDSGSGTMITVLLPISKQRL